MDEGEGESSSPARPLGGPSPRDALRNEIYERLLDSGNEEVISNPNLRDLLDAHLSRLPLRYGLDLNMERVEDVLLHQKILADAEDPDKRPIFHVRFMKVQKCIQTGACEDDAQQQSVRIDSNGKGYSDIVHEGDMVPNLRNRDRGIEFEPCSKLEDLNLDVKDIAQEIRDSKEVHSMRHDIKDVAIHEIIFSSIDKPKLLSQLSALLADIGLNIREAHVFSTTDGYSLDVFEVDGWPEEETDGLLKELDDAAIAYNEGSLSGASRCSSTEKVLGSQSKVVDWEIDRRFLKMGKKIARGSCGDLYRATYLGQDVAVKILRADQLNEALLLEFNQEVDILRRVHHKNIVHYIGACVKPTELCIITEYMTGGNLYDHLHKQHISLELPHLLKFSIDICKGMDYLHQNNIIHRDLKTANLLLDANSVVKVGDFGVARFQNQEGVMTAETGTYRWMAPEVINHQHYDNKADVFSFAIVLWELATSRVPYDNMTPLQAALGVRQGLRPDIPKDMHPRLAALMQRCWDEVPSKRPSFEEITQELEELLHQVQASSKTSP
ncbi:serine/threonine-protein kinase STY8-like isoform X1 [Musa acuminata AAA Group]|uniref:serine/threonine-protein kinase STY8-like isoform X1 n=1 Tax=Musa acuminata AAA Group TaxID=214697 RepID=UPI0031D6C60F